MDYTERHTVRLPAAFEGYFTGTGVAQGTDTSTPSTKAAYEAWRDAKKVRAGGSGHSWLVTGSAIALDEIRWHAQNFVAMCGPEFEHDKSELAAARIWVRRINNVLHDWPEEDR
jgi:hypothetical protein